MTGSGSADPVLPPPQAQASQARNLMLRVASSAILAPIAVLVAVAGGWPFIVFWTLASVVLLREWSAIVCPLGARIPFAIGALALALAGALAGLDAWWLAAMAAGVGMALAGLTVAAAYRLWYAAGVAYAALLLLPICILRADAQFGLAAVLLLFAIVWTTDIFGYGIGRLIGGPLLAPHISPKKTLSGALGGTAGALAAAIGVNFHFATSKPVALGVLAVVLSIASQAGDLGESALKRKFGVKDAGHIIPGHGGLMDRLDGFIAAALAAALIGVSRGGTDAAARGLLVW